MFHLVLITFQILSHRKLTIKAVKTAEMLYIKNTHKSDAISSAIYPSIVSNIMSHLLSYDQPFAMTP